MKRILVAVMALGIITSAANADLLNSLIWAGTKAAAISVVEQAAASEKARKNSNKKTRKKSHRKTRKKSRKKTVVYHCSAKALRASGWTESTSLSKAKKGAIRQCMKRRVSSKACVIQNCYKK